MSELKQETLTRIQNLRKEIDHEVQIQRFAIENRHRVSSSEGVFITKSLNALSKALSKEMKFYNSLP